MFLNQNDLFMEICRHVTDGSYAYILNDNNLNTPAGHQVLSNVFRGAHRYDINGETSAGQILGPPRGNATQGEAPAHEERIRNIPAPSSPPATIPFRKIIA